MKRQSKYIKESSDYFEQVKDLWRFHSSTLGFFPEGAFKEYAANNCILVAECDNVFAGYLLFRKVKGRSPYPQAVIVHLCIIPQFRKEGIAKFLVEQLCLQLDRSYLHLRLTCRKDYSLNEFWIKLGFVYKGENIGRSGQLLVKWERTFRELPLPLLEFAAQLQKPKYKVVIDANVCYRLQDPMPDAGHDRTLSLEAKALEADWIKEDIELVVTNELPNEIQKNNDPDRRASRIAFTKQFGKITTDFRLVEERLQLIRGLFPEDASDNVRSDMYQLAHSSAGGCHYFITQDLPLLNKANDISDRLGITILSPGELISHVDELNKAAEYQPRRLAGSNRLHTSKLSFNKVDSLYECFRKNTSSERKSIFLNRVRSFLSLPEKYEQFIYSQLNKKIAFVVYDISRKDILTIPVIRVSKTDIYPTIIRYLIRNIVIKSIKEKKRIVIIHNEECENELFTNALIDNNFIKCDEKWVKINIFGVVDTEHLLIKLEAIRKTYNIAVQAVDILMDNLGKAEKTKCLLSFVDLEKKLYPLKIFGSLIPSYVIPIKPGWAQHLFDETLAEQTLFGANENLLMRIENVFYRSKYSFGEIAVPGRILWYVTSSEKVVGSKMIRACSYIDEVKIGSAKDLYKKYRRYGVYRWNNISEMVNGESSQDIMAIIFSNTELLPVPIPLKEYHSTIAIEEGKSPVLQSPQKIAETTFCSLYAFGVNEYYE